MRSSDLHSTAKLVAFALSFYMDTKTGGRAHPGAPRLGRDCSLSPRAVRHHLESLVGAGWLELVERGGLRGQAKRANEYRATIPKHPDPCTSVTGYRESPVTQDALTGNPHDTDGLPRVTPSLHRSLHFSSQRESVDNLTSTANPAVGEERKERDAIKARCIDVFTPRRVDEDDCRRMVDQLRSEGIADMVLEEALGQCQNASARHLRYFEKVARNWFRQRTGAPV